MNKPVASNARLPDDLSQFVDNPPKWLVSALSVDREEGYVNANGCKIHYFRWGDPSKPPLVLLHGFLSHARCFAFIAPFLSENHHIVAYDLSGMGDSDSRHSYPDDVRVSELMQLASGTGLFDHDRKPTIIAHSYGGRVGLAAVTEYPEKFAGLIICDLMIIRPEILASNAEQFSRPGNQDPDRPNKIYTDLEKAKSRFILAPPQTVEEPVLLDFMAYHSLRESEEGWSWKFSPSVFHIGKGGMEQWAKAGENLVAAPGRKAVVYGEQSLLFTADSINYIKEIGGVGFPIIGIPNAGHHLMLDQPIAFASVLKTILATWE